MTAVEFIEQHLFLDDNWRRIFQQAKEMEQQQQGYSEEDMRECWMACLGFNKPEKFNSRVKFEEWFKQFKSK